MSRSAVVSARNVFRWLISSARPDGAASAIQPTVISDAANTALQVSYSIATVAVCGVVCKRRRWELKSPTETVEAKSHGDALKACAKLTTLSRSAPAVAKPA